MFTQLPPVGNPISLGKRPFNNHSFSSFKFVGFHSGTAALAEALISAKRHAKSVTEPEVLVAAYTCPDIISAANYAGVKVTIIDFERHTPWLDLEQCESHINSNTVAIIAINFLGISERTESLLALCRRFDILLIEDSAQGFPQQSYDDYWRGDIIVTSFGRGKPLSLLGGGGLLYKDSALQHCINHKAAEPLSWLQTLKSSLKIRLLNILSLPACYFWLTKLPGLKLGNTCYHQLANTRAIDNYKLQLLSKNQKNYNNRPLMWSFYRTLFAQLNNSNIIDLSQQCAQPQDKPLLRFPILVTDAGLRSALLAALNKSGLGATQLYKKPLPQVQGVNNEWLTYSSITSASEFSEQLITLPTHQGVSQKWQKKLTEVITQVCQNTSLS